MDSYDFEGQGGGSEDDSLLSYSSTASSRVQDLKDEVKYLLERQRLLGRDVYENDAHNHNGIDFRYDIITICQILLGNSTDHPGTAVLSSPLLLTQRIQLLRFPQRDIIGETAIDRYISSLYSVKQELLSLLPSLAILFQISPEQVLVGQTHSMISTTITFRYTATHVNGASSSVLVVGTEGERGRERGGGGYEETKRKKDSNLCRSSHRIGCESYGALFNIRIESNQSSSINHSPQIVPPSPFTPSSPALPSGVKHPNTWTPIISDSRRKRERSVMEEPANTSRKTPSLSSFSTVSENRQQQSHAYFSGISPLIVECSVDILLLYTSTLERVRSEMH